MPAKRLRAILGNLTLGATYAYAASVLILFALIRWVGDDWPPVAVILLMPRWLLMVPVAVLAVLSGLLARRSQWLLQGAVALLIAGPFMGLSIPWRRFSSAPAAGITVRIMTLNVAQNTLDAERLIALLEQEHVDVVCFQEGRRRLKELDRYFARGWHEDRSRLVASRFPIVEELSPLPEKNRPEARRSGRLYRVRVRTGSGAEFVVASAHLPTLRPGFYRAMERDFHGLAIHHEWWRHELGRIVDHVSDAESTPLLLAGDFNMPDDNSSMASLGEIFRSAWSDSGWAYGYTRPSHFSWVRIDHIFGSPEWTFLRCWVGPDLGSDHLPLLADAVLTTDRPQLADAAHNDSR